MRRALESFAWRMWRGDAGVSGRVVSGLLLPFEGLWRMVTAARNRRYDRAIPAGLDGLAVISVGNVAVGGTGKTPVSAWFVDRLLEAGRRPCVVLRGYGGDEVALHGAWHGDVPVYVDKDRSRALRSAGEDGCDVAVLDDGFQHRSVGRALDVVLVAVEDPVPGAVLPRGPYREPLTALQRADVIILTRRHGAVEEARALQAFLRDGALLAAGATTASLRLAASDLVSLAHWSASRRRASSFDAPDEEGARPDARDGVVALTSVARPWGFETDVAAVLHTSVELLAYPDHHAFTRSEAREARMRAGARPIVVTEKDAVKLASLAEELGDTWVLEQSLVWDWGEDDVRRRLAAVTDVCGEEEE